jgi:hypothetical protein
MDPILSDLSAARQVVTSFDRSMRILAKGQSIEKAQGQAIVDMIAAAGAVQETPRTIYTRDGRVDTLG